MFPITNKSAHRAGRGVLGRAVLMGFAFLVSGLLVSGAQAASVQLELKPNSQLWLEGKSSLHEFSSKATQINLTLNVKDSSAEPKQVLTTMSGGGAISQLVVDVPVKGLKSGKGALDDNLYSALKVNENPRIQFKLVSYKMQAKPSADGTYSANVTGILTIAGKSRPVSFAVAAKTDKDSINIWGSNDLKMTEYGITPPTAMMGMIRCDDQVKVNFDLTLGVKSAVSEN